VKGLFWVLGAFALAVAVSLAFRPGEGYVLVVAPPYRIDFSITFAAIMLVVAFAVVYGLVRIAVHAARLPAYVRRFRARQREEKARGALLGALQAWFEGRFSRAEKLAATAWDLGASPAATSLVAARAAQRVRNRERRDLWLGRADQAGREWRQAALATRGELLVEARDFEQASAVLHELHDSGAKHIATLQMLLRSEQALGRWEEVIRIARLLEKRSGLPPEAIQGVLLTANMALLKKKTHDPQALAAFWRGVSERERLGPQLAEAAAKAFIQLGDCRSAHHIIEDAIEVNWSAPLALLYGECQDEDALARLEKAESWLQARPRDAVLLLTLGRLCVQRELWGKAQSYLEASLAVRPTRTAHIALAQLFDRIGRPHDANRHYRAGADPGLAAEV
jgi:HemY protein